MYQHVATPMVAAMVVAAPMSAEASGPNGNGL